MGCLEGINYTPQGKLGAAVLGNVETRIFQLLLYKGQQQHVTSARITSKFQFTVQANNYGTFYDDQSQNWSIMFEGTDHAVEFAREIGLAIAISQGAEEQLSPSVQDLLAGTGMKVNFGDALEVQYSAKQLTGHHLGKDIDNSVVNGKGLRVKVKKDVWEECLVGLSKGARRLIVVPPNLMGMWKEQVEVNSRLVLEVEVSRVKISSGSKENVSSRLPSLHDSGESAFDSSADDGSIKARGASISEALTNSPKTNKASIISRMAKMGQATLPLKGAITCNPSDSEETEEESGSGPKVLPMSAKPAAKPRSMKSRSSVATPAASDTASGAAGTVPQSIAVYHGVGVPWQQAQHPSHAQQFMRNGSVQQFTVASPYAVEGQLYPVVPHMVSAAPQVFQAPATTPPALASPDTLMAVFLSETRTHNSEVRMGVAKVADKVDQLMCKFDGFQQQQQQQQQLQLQQRPVISGGLDPETLLASIQKIVVENEQLRTEIADKRSKLDELNDKMYKLLQANQKLMEQNSNKMDQGDTVQAVIVALQQEKNKVGVDLQLAESTVSSLQSQVSYLREREAVVTSELSSLSSQLQAAKEEVERKASLLQGLENQLRQSESSQRTLEESLQSSQLKLSKVTQEKEELAKQLDVASQRLGNELMQAENAAIAKYKEQIQELESKLTMLASLPDTPSEKEMEEEFDKMMTLQKDEMEKKFAFIIQNMEEEINRLKLNSVEAASQGMQSNGDTNRSLVVDEVKKVMNLVYKQLHVRFQPNSSFHGSEIRDILVSTIRDVTLHLLAANDPAGAVESNRSSENVAVPKPSGASTVASENISLVQESVVEIPSESHTNVETRLKSSMLDSGTKTASDSENKTDDTNIVLDRPRESPTVSSDQKMKEPKKTNEEFFSDKDWLPQRPVPPPLFDDNDDEDDDWLS